MIHEIQRIANTVPLSVYHCTTRDTNLMGYFLPRVRSVTDRFTVSRRWFLVVDLQCPKQNTFMYSCVTKHVLNFLYYNKSSVRSSTEVIFLLRVLWSSKTSTQCWMKRDSGNSLMNSTLKTSWMTKENLLNPRPSCLSLRVWEFKPLCFFLLFEKKEAYYLLIENVSCFRSSYVSWRRSGSYGALPHRGDSAEEV